jgi:hypothetical protein
MFGRAHTEETNMAASGMAFERSMEVRRRIGGKVDGGEGRGQGGQRPALHVLSTMRSPTLAGKGGCQDLDHCLGTKMTFTMTGTRHEFWKYALREGHS